MLYCPNCGGYLYGDGVRDVLHCEFADYDAVHDVEPDAQPIYCTDKSREL